MKKNIQQKKKLKIALITLLSILVIFFLIILPMTTYIIYHDNFGIRYESTEWMTYSVSDFENLNVEECTFPSNHGQQIAGYQYSKNNQDVYGVIVLSHGFGGGGHNSYMDLADYFTSNGYLVFAYDVTGCDKSEGDCVEGLPQGVIDLDYALRYIKQTDAYSGLPIMLFGHSWGGYSAGNVLNRHSDVKAAVLIAGFNRSTDMLQACGQEMIGPAFNLLMPYIFLYEKIKFGKYASYNAIDGFANTDAHFLIVNSKNDDMIPSESGSDGFSKVYGNNPRFTFVQFDERGHNYVYYTDASRQYKEQLEKRYDSYVELNGMEDNDETRSEFMKKNLDKNKCYEFDYDLMQKITEFYNQQTYSHQ